jgi:hypothetical protein
MLVLAVMQLSVVNRCVPITVAARSTACTVFASSDAGIVGSNLIHIMDVYECVHTETAITPVYPITYSTTKREGRRFVVMGSIAVFANSQRSS